MGKQLFVYSLLLILASAPVAAAIYKHFDENGNVVYSDVPSKSGAKPHKPAAITTIKSRPTKTASDRSLDGEDEDFSDKSSAQQPEETAVVDYKDFSISYPADGDTIRANGGSLSVELSLDPELSTEHNHKFVVTMDGDARQESTAGSVTFVGVIRGMHTIAAKVIDDSDTVLTSASPVTVNVLRHSALFRKKSN